MVARLSRVVAVSVAVLVGALLMPAIGMAQSSCALSVPSSVNVDDAVTITGSGFPPNAAIDVTLTLEGGEPVALTPYTDAAGTFTVQFTADTGDVGRTTVTASAGSCSAQATFTVAAPLVPSPSATPSPGAISAPSATASPGPTRTPRPKASPGRTPSPRPTAAGGHVLAATGKPPTTNTAPDPMSPASEPNWQLATLFAVLTLVGVMILALTGRRTRAR